MMTRVTWLAMLLAVFGSDTEEPTRKVFVKIPEDGAFTVNVKFVIPPFVRLASNGQVTMPALFAPPPLALMNVTPAGKRFVTRTLLATKVPRFVITSVYVKLFVASTVAGPVRPAARSADNGARV